MTLCLTQPEAILVKSGFSVAFLLDNLEQNAQHWLHVMHAVRFAGRASW